ncbi:AMP-binding protein [Rhodopila sp.]|uniref:AMP-binding protein n=1 Tax=Rhodopila sp. TaxID=2480087 RepID=UPI003D1234BF
MRRPPCRNPATADRDAVIWEGESGDVRRITYRELRDQVARCANRLRSLGVNRGDVVAIYLTCSPAMVCVAEDSIPCPIGTCPAARGSQAPLRSIRHVEQPAPTVRTDVARYNLTRCRPTKEAARLATPPPCGLS